jgi:hypothetical protein
MQTILEGNGVTAVPGRSILSISGIKMLPYFHKFGSIWKIPYRGSWCRALDIYSYLVATEKRCYLRDRARDLLVNCPNPGEAFSASSGP